MKTVLYIVIMLVCLAQNSKAGIKDRVVARIDNIMGSLFGDNPDEVEVSTFTTPTLKKEQTASTGRVWKKEEGWIKKEVVPDIYEKTSGNKLKSFVKDGYLFCERINPDTHELELFAHIPAYKTEGAAEFLTVRNASTSMDPTFTRVSTSTIPNGDVSAIVIRKPKPIEVEAVVEKKVEVPEPSIRTELVTSTSTAPEVVKESGVVFNNTLTPEVEVSDKPFKPLEPLVVEAARDHQVPETSPMVGNQKVKERGLWVVNDTSKDFQVVVHVYRNGKSEDVDMGMLGEGQKMFLPCPLDFIALSLKRGMWFRKDIRMSFTEDSVDQVNMILKQDGSVVETRKENS